MIFWIVLSFLMPNSVMAMQLFSGDELVAHVYTFDELVINQAQLLRDLVEQGKKSFVPELRVAEATLGRNLQTKDLYTAFQASVDPDTFKFTCLIEGRNASRRGLLWSIDYQSDIQDILQCNPYVVSAYDSYQDKVTQYDIFPADTFAKYYTPLHYVLVKLQPRWKNSLQETAHLMVYMQLLLEAGANPHAINSGGMSSFDLASTQEQVDLLRQFEGLK